MEKIYKNNKGKICGYLMNDGIYRKKVDSKKHKLRVMDAYGVDLDIVNELKNAGCTEIRILEIDTSIILSISFLEFVEKGVTRNLDGEQVLLPVKYFKTEPYK